MSFVEQSGAAGPDAGRGIRSPIELIAAAATRYARGKTTADARHPQLQQWCDGMATVRADRAPFAEYWRRRNEWALAGNGPLWVALGDSAAQGLGAAHPQEGYVGQAHAHLAHRTGQPWRVLNLSCSGATIQDVLDEQLPRLASLAQAPALVTCGIGVNDLFRTPLPKVRAQLRTLIEALPGNAVMLDIPLPRGRWRIGRLAVPLVARANSAIHAAARARRLPVAYVSSHFTAPWGGKFGPDDFHPNDVGYRDWCQALVQAVPGMSWPALRPATVDAELVLAEPAWLRYESAA
jgi:lysophospholipase L1-like esterase